MAPANQGAEQIAIYGNIELSPSNFTRFFYGLYLLFPLLLFGNVQFYFLFKKVLP
jgi:hypothetical protein